MKISTVAFLASITTSAAFVPRSHNNMASVQMSYETEEEIAEAIQTGEPTQEEAVFADSPAMSRALPWMKRPAALDGSLPGDAGFDPLGFAKTKEDLYKYREAEIKHGRLAMLAAAGWPLSEVFDRKIASFLGLPAVLESNDRAPSILNGGLGKVSPLYWAGCLAAAAAIDLYGIQKKKNNPDMAPGDLGFDPLGLYPMNDGQRQHMQVSEIKNGRLAMIAITAFAAQEFVSKIGVVNETPLFFKPVSEVIPYSY